MAISQNRLLTWEDDHVTLRYQDSDTGEVRFCTVTAEECIRRFLQHGLPDGFVNVRYDGVLSPGHRALLQKARLLLGVKPIDPPSGGHGAHGKEQEEAFRCPTCGPIMVLRETWRPNSRSPP